MLKEKLKNNEITQEIKEYLEEKYNIKIKKKLGGGAFGEVYHISTSNNISFALKIYKPIKINENKFQLQEQKIKDEIRFSLNLKSNNIILGLKSGENQIKNQKVFVLFMEKARFIDLNLFIYNYINYNFLAIKNKTNKFQWLYNFSEETIKFFAYQIIKVFEFLDLNLIVHFDIKPGNLLLGDNFTIKLSDFSVTKQIVNKHKKATLQTGTYQYMSPEFYNNSKEVLTSNIRTIDYFAFGCILFSMIARKDLIKDIKDEEGRKIKANKDNIINFINEGKSVIKNLNYSTELKQLVSDLINVEAENRPKISELVDNKWVNKDYDLIRKIKNINYNQSLKIFVELQKAPFCLRVNRKRKKFNF